MLLSYSWSANVAGCKRWTLYPPSETPKLVRGDGKCPADFPPPAPGARRVVLVQQAGEALFVPSGWYHEVENLEPTLSINHNWTNGFGLRAMWTFLASELAAVRALTLTRTLTRTLTLTLTLTLP